MVFKAENPWLKPCGIRLYCLTAILLATPFLCFLVRVLQTTAPEDWCAISLRTWEE